MRLCFDWALNLCYIENPDKERAQRFIEWAERSDIDSISLQDDTLYFDEKDLGCFFRFYVDTDDVDLSPVEYVF